MKKSLRSWVLFLPFFTLPLCSASTLNQGNQVANQVAAEKPALDSDGQKKWWKAMKNRDVAKIKSLFREYEVDLWETDKGKTAFHYVAELSCDDPKDNRITKLLTCGFVRQLEPKVIPNGIPSMIFAFCNYISYQNEIFDLLLKDKEEKTEFIDQLDREGNRPLDILAGNLCIGSCKNLVEKHGVNPNDNNLLHKLAKKGDIEALKVMEKCSADINTQNKEEERPLEVAGDTKMFRYLVEHPKVNLRKKTPRKAWTIAHHVVSRDVNFLNILKEKIEKDSKQEENPNKVADYFNQRDFLGRTPFFIATEKKDKTMCEFLINECGVDPNIRNNYRETPFFNVALMAFYDESQQTMCEFLVNECGVNPNIPDNRETVLHRIVVGGAHDKYEKEMLKFLVDKCGVNPNIRNKNGETVFSTLAVRFGEKDKAMCKFLVKECGVNPNIPNKNGETAFYIRATFFDQKLCKFLINECGANPNIPNENGETIFFNIASEGACYKENKDTSEYWKKRNLNSYQKNKAMCKFLVMVCGADPNIPDNNGKTVLEIAREKGNDDMCKFLRNIQSEVYWRKVGNFFLLFSTYAASFAIFYTLISSS